MPSFGRNKVDTASHYYTDTI